MLNLETFINAYLVTALWSSNDESNPETGGDPLDQNYSIDDIAPTDLKTLRAQCVNFLAAQQAGDIIKDAIETGKVACGPDFDEWGRAGHDFWLTRNGHGAGFWDGDWPEPQATQLTKICRQLPEVDLYVSDNDQIRIA